MSDKCVTFGILTVSDRCSNNEAVDESGPLLEKLIEESSKITGGNVVLKACVPDDADKIEEILKEWSDVHKVNVILTSGGTGFAPRDVTPEATKKVIDKAAPGITFAMFKASYDITPMAMLSRAVCGIRTQTLIVNFPGSKKAAKECFEIIEDCIPHAISLILDKKNEVKSTHDIVQGSSHAGCSGSSSCSSSSKPECSESKECETTGSCCKLTSTIDTSRVARRSRQSPYPMISVKDSISLVRQHCVQYLGVETVPLQNALGRKMSDYVTIKHSLPPFRASLKDGYAAIAGDGVGVRDVLGSSVAGSNPADLKVTPGKCVRINTGAPVPDGADCVIQVEDTELVEESDDGREEVKINVLVPPTIGQDIREIGSDFSEHERLVFDNPLTSEDLGLLASVGICKVPVYKIPKVAVFSTGNELQELGQELEPGQVYDCNRLMLLSILRENSFPTVDMGIVKDNVDSLFVAMDRGLQEADIVVSTGSVSMGDRDHLKDILKNDIKATIHFGRVNLKPGKPTTFATVIRNGQKKFIFCLPGNPFSAAVTCHLYVLFALQCTGFEFYKERFLAKLDSDQPLDPREKFKRGHITFPSSKIHTEFPHVSIIGGDLKSSNLSLIKANCLVNLPARTEEQKVLKQWSVVECILIRPLL